MGVSGCLHFAVFLIPIAAETTLLYQCTVCRKTFKSPEMLEQHFESKKHIKAAKAQGGVSDEDATKTLEKKEDKKPEEEEAQTEEARVARQIAKGRRLGFLECSFCGQVFEEVEATAAHMGKAHGFFIPDVEYLDDLPGMLAYIGDKVGVGHCCLYCDRAFDSLKATRSHMIDMSHCKLPDAQGEEEDDEFEQFYDYSEQEANGELPPEMHMSPDGTMLYVGDSGRAIGHRDLQVYYKQNVRFGSGKAVIAHGTRRNLIMRYRQIGWKEQETPEARVKARRARQAAYRAQSKQQEKMYAKTEKINEKRFVRRDLAW